MLHLKPLNSKTREIMLVTIEPGDFDDEIHCTLSSVSLNDSLDYEALSYVWAGREIPTDASDFYRWVAESGYDQS